MGTQPTHASATVAPSHVSPSGGTRLFTAPQLLNPGDGQTTGDGRIIFKWTWYRALDPDECFEVVMSNNLQGPLMGAQACTSAKEANLNVLEIRSIPPAPNGEYFWTVRVNRESPDGTWSTISTFETPRRIRVSNSGGS